MISFIVGNIPIEDIYSLTCNFFVIQYNIRIETELYQVYQ